MSDSLSVPHFTVPLRPMTELYNVAHERPYSILFANYSWALGIAGGLALLWAINAWRGERARVEHRFALPLVVAFIIGGFVNVLSEVEQPGRLFHGYIYGWYNWDTAIIKYGIILLPLFLLVSWWLSFQAMPREQLGAEIDRLSAPWRQLANLFSFGARCYGLFENRLLSRFVLVGVVVLALFAPLYSAVFLMNEHGVPVWNSPAQAILYLASSVGIAATLMLVAVPAVGWLATGRWLAPSPNHRWTALIAFGLCAVVWFGWMAWLARFGSAENLRAVALFQGPYGAPVFWNWVVIGLIVPILALITPLGRSRIAQTIACLGGLWGGYAIRAVVLLGGEALIRSGAGYQTFRPDANAIWYSGVAVLLFIGFLAALLAATPRGPAPSAKV
jgi:formate-dependent nitrite reductase membrane component NrfD